MFNNKIVEENRQKSDESLRFGLMAIIVMLINAVLNLLRGLTVSGILVLLMSLPTFVILAFIYKGKTKSIIGAIVFTVNPFLILINFAEGLKSGSYLFILPLILALGFLMSKSRVILIEAALYFIITVASFCICIFFCGETSTWQEIPSSLYNEMFTENCVIVVCLCAVFAYIGIYFERKFRLQLIEAKNKAEIQERKIKWQNKNLQDIAFMNAHILRSPLANILAIIALIDAEKVSSTNKELIEHLQTSAQQLDDAIKEIVARTADRKSTNYTCNSNEEIIV